MKRLENHLIGIDQGDTVVFSEFQQGGEMWTGMTNEKGRPERTALCVFCQ